MVLIVKASAPTGALTNPVPLLEPPAGAIDCTAFRCAKWLVGGTTSAGDLINYQLIGWLKAIDETVSVAGCWLPVLLAKGVATLGDATYTVTSLGAATRLWADTLTIPNPTKYAAIATHVGDQAIAVVETNLNGFSAVSCDTDINTADTTDVLVHLERDDSPGI